MKRSDDRILTTHVGSLIRPPMLLQLAAAAKERPAEQQKYLDALREATVAVVKRQAEAGVDIVNDGEYGKSSWANYVLSRMTGFEPRPDTLYEAVWLGRDRFRFKEFMAKEFPARRRPVRRAMPASARSSIGAMTAFAATSTI